MPPMGKWTQIMVTTDRMQQNVTFTGTTPLPTPHTSAFFKGIFAL